MRRENDIVTGHRISRNVRTLNTPTTSELTIMPMLAGMDPATFPNGIPAAMFRANKRNTMLETTKEDMQRIFGMACTFVPA